MEASWRGAYVVAAGEEDGDSDSDEDGWDIGVAQREPQDLDQMLQEDKNAALKKALVRSDVQLIEELLNSGTSIESTFQFGWTPLMYAASMADFAVVRLLLDRGANAGFEIDKYTVLMAACTAISSEEKILKTVELLLSRNADPNLSCRRQMTPLMYAAKKGCPKVVALLVANGSHINAQDENGYSALIWAAQLGHKNVIFKLLELGADKNLRTKDEKTAAEIAKLNNHLEGLAGAKMITMRKAVSVDYQDQSLMLRDLLAQIYSLLSLAANCLQGRYCEMTKQEAIYSLASAVADQRTGSYSAFDGMEVFLHGVGLEHIVGLLKEKDVTLRQLLNMQKDELIEIGITNPRDQQKLLDATNELQVEERTIGDLPEVMKLELSEDEVLTFLRDLNKECRKLIIPVQTANKHFLKNSHKMVMLQWAPTESFIEACKELVCSIENLRGEVMKLKDLIEKEQKNDPCQVKLPDKAHSLENRLVKMGAVALLGFVFYFGTKLVLKKT